MKFINYFNAITLLFLISLCAQSCTNDPEIRLQGRIIDEASGLAIENAVFTLYDYSTKPENFADIFAYIGEEQVTTDKDGFFNLTFEVPESTDQLFYEYSANMAKSDEVPVSINVGESLDMGDLIIPETVEVVFDISSLDLNNQDSIKITTGNEDNFSIRNENENENENGTATTTIGYVYPNQLNRVLLAYYPAPGSTHTVKFEITVGEVNKGDVIVLER